MGSLNYFCKMKTHILILALFCLISATAFPIKPEINLASFPNKGGLDLQASAYNSGLQCSCGYDSRGNCRKCFNPSYKIPDLCALYNLCFTQGGLTSIA